MELEYTFCGIRAHFLWRKSARLMTRLGQRRSDKIKSYLIKEARVLQESYHFQSFCRTHNVLRAPYTSRGYNARLV